jgi:oligoribonuclease
MKPTKLLWVDLEMTGLDPDVHRILEVGAFITDFSLAKLPGSEYHALVRQPDDVLEAASDVVKQMDAGNGLLKQVRLSGRPEAEVQNELAALIREHFSGEPATLAGNSIHQDRRFIRRWWPDVEALLHYRMLDVSSFKVWMQGKYDLEFVKQETHRAVDDIGESITELEYYLTWLREGVPTR